MQLFLVLFNTFSYNLTVKFKSVAKPKNIRCPNCGYKGEGKLVGTNALDLLIFVCLLVLGIIPGILWLVFQAGKAKKSICPKCGYKYVVPI